ncbi:MAG: rRNA maturation RNase YbeY [Chitinophagales bacterium]
MAVRFHKADVSFRVPQSTSIKSFLSQQFSTATGKALDLDCIFCSDEYLLNVNRTFLQHDYYTDIITFPLDETEKKTVAEIYISIDRVKENATAEKVSFENELQRVIFHGVLHLCGFKDKTKAQSQLMREMENQWLAEFTKLVA